MMKAVIIDGSRQEPSSRCAQTMAAILRNAGWEASVFQSSKLKIEPCRGCFDCWVKTPGICCYSDDVATVLKEQVVSDLLVYVSPICWGCYSPELKLLNERSLPVVLPYFEKHQGCTHHEMRYSKLANFIAIGIDQNDSEEETRLFKEYVSRNLLNFRTKAAVVETFRGEEAATEEQLSMLLKSVGVVL